MNKSGHQQPNKWDFITCNSKGVYYAWLLWEAAGFLKDLTTKGERLELGQAAANAAPRNRKRKNSVPINVVAPPDEAVEAGDRARDLKQMNTIASWASNTNIDAAVREQANQMMTKFMDKLSKNLDIGASSWESLPNPQSAQNFLIRTILNDDLFPYTSCSVCLCLSFSYCESLG
jgi:hypothetical protein